MERRCINTMYDVLIQNAKIADGSGGAAYRGDIAVAEGRIAAVGKLDGAQAARVVDAAGRYAAPGFIDIHRHADGAVFAPDFGEAELSQGLTSIVNGCCGLSAAPCFGQHRGELASYLLPVIGSPERSCAPDMADYLDHLAKTPLPLNAGMFVGLGSARACVAGYEKERLSGDDTAAIAEILEDSLRAGALGISLGLGYEPEGYYTTEELIDALRPAANRRAPVCVHMRQEGAGVVGALQEMLHIARALDLNLEISHLKGIGRAYWHRAVPEMLSLLEAARAEGVCVGYDVYPYTAGSTQLIHILPPEAKAFTLEEVSQHLREPSARKAMRERMRTGTDFENISLLVGWENIVVSSAAHEYLRRYEGFSIAEIAGREGRDPFDCAFDLLAADTCGTTMIDRITCEEDIECILREEGSCVISDAIYPTAGMWHPRVCGSFARLFEEYVVRRGALTVEKAVQKATSLPAQRLGLSQKGRIAEGMDADIVLFDLARVHETGTFAEPKRCAEGFDFAMVGGKFAVDGGKMTGVRAGSVLRGRF